MARLPLTLAALLALLLPLPVHAQDEPEPPEDAAATEQRAPAPRYLAAVRAELERLDVNASCEVLDPLRARCSWRVQNSERTRELTLRALVDESTQTLYLYAPIATAHPDDAETTLVLRRIAELNWRYLASKAEWNSATGEVRISAIQHLDTNFDRRAFRVLVRLLARQSIDAAAEISTLIPDN
ncbi:MAG: hypothetical protein ACI9KE_002919 [Polyangiales bacterium]|jgi:hypothetical protein